MQTLFELMLTNAVGATLLAGVVFGVTRVARHPRVAHILWLLVLVKLITPPLVSIPVALPAHVDRSEAISIVLLAKVLLELPLHSPIWKHSAQV